MYGWNHVLKKDLWMKVTVWHSSIKSDSSQEEENDWSVIRRLEPGKLGIHPCRLIRCWTSWWMCAKRKISLVNSILCTVMSETTCYPSPGAEPAHRCPCLEVPSSNAIKQIGSRAPSPEKRPAFLWWRYWLLETEASGWKEEDGAVETPTRRQQIQRHMKARRRRFPSF